jgi:uroporphyrin-III C-methyltransferase
LNYEVIPGVTSALAAASLYGIPLTERGKNSMVLFGTGHYSEGEFLDIDTFVSVLKSGSPIIIYMGLNKLIRLSTRLIEQSISGDTSVQILSKVSQPDAYFIEGTLENIAQVIESKKPNMPALVIIGKNVVKLNVAGRE